MMRWVLLGLLLASAARAGAETTVTVGSKAFSESRLLAEMFAQTLEATGEFRVERRFNLAGTAVCFRALKAGDIDLYPEYTGTGFAVILGHSGATTPAAVLATVRREFRSLHDAAWLAPLGFENAYEVAVRREVAEAHGLGTISDLAAVAGELSAGFGFEFRERDDGFAGLARVYGLDPGRILSMQQNLKYEAAGRGEIDILDVYTTDGLILVHDLVVLEDDRDVFPPYQAAALVRGSTLRGHPSMGPALTRLSGTLDEATMRDLNRRVEVDGAGVAEVASSYLSALGILDAPLVGQAAPSGTGFPGLMWTNRAELLGRTVEHLVLVFVALFLSVILAVPAGLALSRFPGAADGLVAATGVLQTIPSIALLAFMIPVLGVGTTPAIAALFLYGIFPVLRNTWTGVRDADPQAAHSALALGMTPAQVLWKVRFPWPCR